jgi:ATP-dependent Zn protease
MIEKRILLPVVLLVLITVPALSVLCVEEAEASPDYLIMDTGTLSKGSFDTRNNADVKITIVNNTENKVDVKVWITYQNESGVLKEVDIEVASEDKTVAVLNLGFGSQGTKYLTVHAKSDDADFYTGSAVNEASHNFTIHVDQSVWSNALTYVAIVLIVIVIAVAIYLRQRNAPKVEPQMTFTELEEMRKSQRKDVDVSSGSSSERRRYESDKRRKR